MHFLNNLKIGHRLALLLGGLLALMATVDGAGLWGQTALYELSRHALEQEVRLASHAAEMRSLVLLERRYEKDSLINLANSDALATYVKRWHGALNSRGCSWA